MPGMRKNPRLSVYSLPILLSLGLTLASCRQVPNLDSPGTTIVCLGAKLKSDGIHPNGEGYRMLAEEVADEVRPWLEERRARGLG